MWEEELGRDGASEKENIQSTDDAKEGQVFHAWLIFFVIKWQPLQLQKQNLKKLK